MNNKNSDLYDYILYKEMRQYGIENFKFTILCESDNQDIINELEDYFIRTYDTIIDNGHGYNNNYGGEHGLHSETTKEKLSKNNFKKGPENISYGKTKEKAFSGKRIKNLTLNIIYPTMRECALSEYGDIKYVKQISKVCNPNSNRFTYKGNAYAFIDEFGNITPKNTKPIKNVGQNGVKIIEKNTNKIFNSIEECPSYFNISSTSIRDRIYKRIKKDKYKDIYTFELYK